MKTGHTVVKKMECKIVIGQLGMGAIDFNNV